MNEKELKIFIIISIISLIVFCPALKPDGTHTIYEYGAITLQQKAQKTAYNMVEKSMGGTPATEDLPDISGELTTDLKNTQEGGKGLASDYESIYGHNPLN